MFNALQQMGFHNLQAPAGSNPQPVLKAPGKLFGSVGKALATFSQDQLTRSTSANKTGKALPKQPLNLGVASTATTQAPPKALPTKPASEQLTVKGLPVTIHWGQRFSSSPSRIPAGYQQIKGSLPKGLAEVSTHILNQKNPIGTYTPFELNGKSYLAINEYHTHYASRPNDPPGKIYAITVFERTGA